MSSFEAILRPEHGKQKPQNLNRSCEACRARKIRCQQVPGPQSGGCTRCEKMNLSCIFAASHVRQRRKRTDVRVAELEKELQSMRDRLDGKEEGINKVVPPSTPPAGTDEAHVREALLVSSSQLGLSSIHDNIPSVTISTCSAQGEEDSLEVSDAACQELFEKFVKDLAPHLPFIHFNNHVSWEDFRRTQPGLFLAISAASAATINPVLGCQLALEVEKTYATRVLMNGEKHLELVQALLITAAWYHPPDRFEDLKFTQYAHMAANMALDIQIGNGDFASINSRLSANQLEKAVSPDCQLLQKQRTYIGCYLLCSSMAMALHRPNMLRFTNWTATSISSLKNSAISSDNVLGAWAKLQHVAEEAAVSLGLDEHNSRSNLLDIRVHSTIRAFEQQLTAWKSANWELVNSSIKIHYHCIRVNLHEISLHLDYDSIEFRPPYLLRPKPLRSTCEVELNPATIGAVMVCVESTHALLDIFLSMNVATLRSIPVIVYTRMFYGVIVLTKMDICARASESSLGRALDVGSLKVLFYLQNLMSTLQKAAGQENFSVPNTFFSILARLTAWYHRRQATARPINNMDELLEPMAYLRTTEATRKLDDSDLARSGGNPLASGPRNPAYSSNNSVYHDAQMQDSEHLRSTGAERPSPFTGNDSSGPVNYTGQQYAGSPMASIHNDAEWVQDFHIGADSLQNFAEFGDYSLLSGLEDSAFPPLTTGDSGYW